MRVCLCNAATVSSVLVCFVLLMCDLIFFLVAFGVGPRLHDPQLTRLEAGEEDLV